MPVRAWLAHIWVFGVDIAWSVSSHTPSVNFCSVPSHGAIADGLFATSEGCGGSRAVSGGRRFRHAPACCQQRKGGEMLAVSPAER